MKLYPHWLDGEFVRIASNARGPQQDVRGIIRAVKLHALLGTQFVISDVQVFDSAAILELFADEKFRNFVESDKDFLCLRVALDGGLGDCPVALAARGLVRTHAPGWKSSVFFDNATPVVKLADEIINEIQTANCVGTHGLSPAIREYEQYSRQLKAVRYAVDHFGRNACTKGLQEPVGRRLSYYDVLHEFLGTIASRMRGLPGHSDIPPGMHPLILAGMSEDLQNM